MIRKTVLALVPVLALTGCNEDNTPLELGILHINDHHSHLEAESQSLMIAGQETQFESGGFARVAALIQSREAELDNVLKLHAGDAITGTLYFTSFKGEADADMMNRVCFDAFALGNHEFDLGDEGLKNFLDYLSNGSCQTPVLAANVKPAIGTPLAPVAQDDYIQPYTVKDIDGARVGIIGIDIANKTRNSSSPLDSTELLDEASTAQAMIDELAADGVNKIILVTHYQYQNDIELAQTLSGVDVIIGGDSHTLLGDFENYGMTPAGSYPTVIRNADGDRVCLGQAWQYSQIVGEMQVRWNARGQVVSCRGVPHLLLGEPITRKNAEGEVYQPSGAELADILMAIDQDDQLSLVPEDASVAAALQVYTDQLDTFRNQIIGMATEDLCLARIPGVGGRSNIAGCDEATREHGSDISNLVAQAFLFQSKEADVAIQNGGGVRTDIAQGDITIGDAYTLLPFANTLVNLDMTGAEIRQVLNEAVEFAHTPDGSSGAYPYAAGLRWDVDMNRVAGERLFNIEVKDRDGGEWRPLADEDLLRVVTNSFTAAGRDGYITFGTVSNDGRMVDTYLDYAQSFADYVTTQGTLSKPALEDYSTQSYTAVQ